MKRCVGHSGRVDHSFVSELYDSTRLLLLGLKYAMLPHTLDEALLSIHGADLHVSNSGLVCLSALMASSFCNFCCLKCWFSSCNFWIIFSPGTACMCSYLFTSFQLLVQLSKLFLPGFNNVIFLLSYLLYFLLSSSDCCIVISDLAKTNLQLLLEVLNLFSHISFSCCSSLICRSLPFLSAVILCNGLLLFSFMNTVTIQWGFFQCS